MTASVQMWAEIVFNVLYLIVVWALVGAKLLLVVLDRLGQVNKLHDHTVGDRSIEQWDVVMTI